MAGLEHKRAVLRSENDLFHVGGLPTGDTLLQFWRWSRSDLLSNATRGVLAEFIVARALGCDLDVPREEWAAYDLTTPEGIKVEVKSAAYVQAWAQPSGLSRISFSIKDALAWYAETNRQAEERSRTADVYVFCLLKHQDKATVDPMDLDQWVFHVLSIRALDGYTRSRHSITLRSLQNISTEIPHSRIREEVLRANSGN
ncbi:MAG TPA: hypothetical protein PKE53_00215 [Flavobacteriales bacterium]|jgi:hypothetical protein|nr:hypothetical protein [Flavobacteriales bacterium]MCC6655382.1 hypothetical protein [Flavobacteriales bacterium]HMU12392.1 hypothetical protein [Flavobacteriales bacterium]HMW96720.1 hypothetical protein [Flavobacteriales bacterium]HNE79836.1 hypothetical protein [Flavobacteriales bacterium]